VLSEFIDRLNELQIRRPWTPLFAVALVTVVFGLFAARLELWTRYDQLLPDSQPSVQELRRVEARTASAQTVMILLEGPNGAALRAMGDALVPQLLALGPDIVSSAEDGTQEAGAFLRPRAGLFLDRKELGQLHDDVFARWDYEVAKESGALLDDNGPPVTISDIEKRFRKKSGDSSEANRPDGYYQRDDGTALVLVVRSPIQGGDLEKTGPALARIRATVESVRASRHEFAPVRASYAGDMPTGFFEYRSIRDDLLSVGASGIALVLAAVLLYFMRLRALFVMGVTIASRWCGPSASRSSSSATSTSPPGSSSQHRRRKRDQRRHPLSVALLRGATQGCPPDFGLTHFGARNVAAHRDRSAGLGRLVRVAPRDRLPRLPGLRLHRRERNADLLDRQDADGAAPPAPLGAACKSAQAPKETGVLARYGASGWATGAIFAWLVPKAPVAMLGAGVLVLVAGIVAGYRYVSRDPMEYDLKATENDPHPKEELDHAWHGVFDILGNAHEGMVVLADTADDARQLQKQLQDRLRRGARGRTSRSRSVHSLWDLVPDDQEAKVPSCSRSASASSARGLVAS
jgi:hypothetical protein